MAINKLKLPFRVLDRFAKSSNRRGEIVVKEIVARLVDIGHERGQRNLAESKPRHVVFSSVVFQRAIYVLVV